MDKASEDEEGQLEEQIERLQEKVESAQSEQKNLFLVIFQVASAHPELSGGQRCCSFTLPSLTLLLSLSLSAVSCSPLQRFIMLLTEHLVRCETSSVDISTPWYKNCIERLQQIFLMVMCTHTHSHTQFFKGPVLYILLLFVFYIC